MLLALTLSLGAALQDAPQRQALGEEEARTVSAVFGQVYEHWNLNCELPGIRDMRIAFDLQLAPDGSIVGQPVLVRPQEGPVYRAAADSARRALLNAAPFEVPEDYRGGVYRPTFLPGRACGEADEP